MNAEYNFHDEDKRRLDISSWNIILQIW